MIRPNIPINNRARKRREQAVNQAQVQAMMMTQNTLNAVLWQMITHNAQAETEERGEDFDGRAGVITIPAEEIDKTPKGFALNLAVDKETKAYTITAIVQKPKSKIVLPDGSRLHE